MIGFCINHKTEFYDKVREYVGNQITREGSYNHLTAMELDKLIVDRIAEITDKLNQEKFNTWYGTGERDTYGQPKLTDDIYITNGEGVKISLKDLFNDDYHEKRENYSKDFTSIDKVATFLDEGKTAIAKRISAFIDTKYAERLTKLLDYLNSLEENDHTRALLAHYNYMLKTLNVFEDTLKKHDTEKGVKSNNAKDKEFKNFLMQAHNFLNSFSKIKNLDVPVTDGAEEKEIIENLKKVESRVDEIGGRINSEIEAVVRDILDEYISNPEVKAGAVDFLAAQSDEGKFQLWLDALGDSHVTFIAAIDKLFKKAMYDRNQDVKEKTREWDKFVQSFNGKFNDFLDRVLEKVDGNRTGKFIPKYSEDFYTEMYAKKNILTTLENQGRKNTKEYQDALDEWLNWRKENMELQYVKEYYDDLNLLIPEARQLKQEIDEKKSAIINRAKGNLSEEDHEELRLLEEEMKRAKASIYPDETPKTGKDLEIANSLTKYSNEMSKYYYTVNINEKDFERARKVAKEKAEKENDPSIYDKWWERNTVQEFSEKFWSAFEKVTSKIPESKQLEKIEDEIKQLTIAFRNDKGEIKVDELSNELKNKILGLYAKKTAIRKGLKKTMKDTDAQEVKEFFRKFVEFTTTGEYEKVYAEMNTKLGKGEITQDAYNNWFYTNHTPNEFTGEMMPLSIWSKMIPKDLNLVSYKPNKYWRKTSIKPEYANPKFDVDESGYPSPSEKWLNPAYEALSEQEREKLEELRNDFLLPLTAHTKNDIIKRGYLPAIPLDTRSNLDTLLNKKNPKDRDTVNAVVTETDDIVKFIPFLYVQKLGQTALPELGSGTTDEENQKIEEERKKVISENRQTHGSKINYDLENTMKAFIKTALNHKHRSAIEIDIKLFREQMKRQKIKASNAKGDTIIDKIKSRLTGDIEEHEISAIGSNTDKHFQEWIDGVFYEDFEKDEGWVSENINRLLNFTSLTTLGFNAFSGLNNKIVGNLQGRIESAGGIHFKYSDYRQARKTYVMGSMSYIADRNTDKASTIVNGLIKHYDVLVSQDELAMKSDGKIKSLIHKARMIKEAAYFMQHIGEHQIQNTTLIAMAQSHRIVNGKIINFNEFWESKKANIQWDAKMTPEEVNAEWQKVKENQDMKKTMEKQFEAYTKLIDAYELKDGYLSIKERIELNDKEEFNFQQRVIGINQRLHGIYNVEDAATIQRYALGRLGMQFRKWMRPMWNRRFGRRFGKKDWNERVRDYEQGMYVSTFNYIFGPAKENWKQYKKQQEKTAAKAFMVLLKSVKDTFTNAKIRWHVLTEVEKANVRRTAAEFLFLVTVTMLGFALKRMKGEDDDDEDKKALVLGLYQADRLFGELTTFTPIGIVRDGNKLFNSPAPVFSTLEDITKLATNLFLYPFRDDEDREFSSGIYHGHKKVEIYAGGLVPFYNQFQKWEYLGEQNQRYGIFR